jgi:hypothetical protein
LPENQPWIFYFAEHSNPQWEIGWSKVQKVILPNFDFGFFSFNGQNLELTKTQKKSLGVCLEQGWPTRIGLWAAFKKNWAKLKTSKNHWIPPQKFLLGPRVGHLWSGGWKSNFLSKKIIKLRKKCSTIFW